MSFLALCSRGQLVRCASSPLVYLKVSYDLTSAQRVTRKNAVYSLYIPIGPCPMDQYGPTAAWRGSARSSHTPPDLFTLYLNFARLYKNTENDNWVSVWDSCITQSLARRARWEVGIVIFLWTEDLAVISCTSLLEMRTNSLNWTIHNLPL